MSQVLDFCHPRPEATVIDHMRPLQPYIVEGVTEVCVNQPRQVFVERCGEWAEHEVPALTFEHCRSLANAVATLTGQHTDEVDPLLGAPLPTGERIQFVQPSAVAAGTVALCIRKPPTHKPRLANAAGLFTKIVPPSRELKPFQRELLSLKEQGRYIEFLAAAVRYHQTICVAGKTGSGKTYMLTMLAEEIPLHERLITIEDSPELLLDSHRNSLHLFYSKNSQGASAVSPKQLMEACLRLRPDRIFLAECRGEEAYYFLRIAASGHPGSLTTVHAGSCALAWEQLALMVRESPAGAGMTMPEVKQLARDVIDIVVHFENGVEGRHITGIHYDPVGRLERLAA